MNPKSAAYLLFDRDFGHGPLFKSQVDVVYELINSPSSDYYVSIDNKDEYSKAVNRLKAYISQLLSESALRKVTREFNNSMRIVISNKLKDTDIDSNEVVDDIIKDIKSNNQQITFNQASSIDKRLNSTGDFIQCLIDSKYISIFTSREIKFEYEIQNKKVSFIDSLLDNLFVSLKNHLPLKYYRFNFPLEQTCELFWRGLRKELTRYIVADKSILSDILVYIKHKGVDITPNFSNTDSYSFKTLEERIASETLNFLSNNEIVNVFHLKEPIYIVPSIALNPNSPTSANTYLFLQSSTSSLEHIHKLTNEELVLWRFFVWDNLKKRKSGILKKYSPLY